MENKPNSGATNARDQNQRPTPDKQPNPGQPQKTGQTPQENNRNDMPPVIGGDKSARPGGQNQNPQNNPKEADGDAEAQEEGTEGENTEKPGNANEKNKEAGQPGNDTRPGSAPSTQKPGQSLPRNQGDRSVK